MSKNIFELLISEKRCLKIVDDSIPKHPKSFTDPSHYGEGYFVDHDIKVDLC